GKDGKARKQPTNKPRTSVAKVSASPATDSNSNNAAHDVGPDSASQAAGLRAPARSKDNGSRAEAAPARGLIWKGDDENGWIKKIENRYYSVTRDMIQGTDRGKNKKTRSFYLHRMLSRHPRPRRKSADQPIRRTHRAAERARPQFG